MSLKTSYSALEEGGRVTSVVDSNKIQTLLFSSTTNTAHTSSDVTDKVTPIVNESKLLSLFGNGSLSISAPASIKQPTNVKVTSTAPLNFTPAVPPSAIFALINGNSESSSDGSQISLASTASIPTTSKSQAIPLSMLSLDNLPRPPLRPPLAVSANTVAASQSNVSRSGIVLSARLSSNASSTAIGSSIPNNIVSDMNDNKINVSSTAARPLPPVLPPQKTKNKLISSTILPSDFNTSSGAFATAMAGGDQLASFLKILEMGGGSGGLLPLGASTSAFEKQQQRLASSASISSGGGGGGGGGGGSGDDISGLALAAACESIGDNLGVQTRNTWQPILLHIHSKRLYRQRIPSQIANSNLMALSCHLANLNVKRGSSQYTALHYACLSLARLCSQFIMERVEHVRNLDNNNGEEGGGGRGVYGVTSLALRQASGLVTLLVAAGADVNARILDSAGGQTPLHFLSSVSYPPLLDENPAKEIASALCFAEECLCRAADAMIFAGADPNALDLEYSQSSLHLSCRNGHPKLSAALVAHGAKTDIEDRFLDNPIDSAEENTRVIDAVRMQLDLRNRQVTRTDGSRSSAYTVFDDLVIKSSPLNGSPHLLMHIVSFLNEKGNGDTSSPTMPLNALSSLQYSLMEGPAKRVLFVEGTLARDDAESSAWSLAAMLLIPPQKKGGQVEVSLKRPPISQRGKRSASVGSDK